MSRPNNLWSQQQTFKVDATEEPLTDAANQKHVHFHKVNTSEQIPDTNNVWTQVNEGIYIRFLHSLEDSLR